MDALDILALGLAAKGGGGGGGTSYSAGDGINISNNTISAKLERGGGLDSNQSGELNVNWSQADISLEQEHQSQAPYSIFDFDTDGFRGEGYEYDNDEGDYLPATSAKMDGGSVNVRVRHVMDDYNDEIEITGTGIEFKNETEDKVLSITSDGDLEWDGTTLATMGDVGAVLPPINSGDAGKALTVNSGETGVEWGQAGGSAGAVRYDEVQSLTTAQKIQAKDNQELPYALYTKTVATSKTVDNAIFNAAAGNISKSYVVTLPQSGIVIGAKIYITVEDSDGFSESIEGVYTRDNGTYSVTVPDDSQYFKSGTWTGFVSTSTLRWTKKDTTNLSIVNPCYYTVWIDNVTYHNPISEKLVDSNFLKNVRYPLSSNASTPYGWMIATPDSAVYQIENTRNVVFGETNKVGSNITGALIVGTGHTIPANTSPVAVIGSSNKTGMPIGTSAPNHKSVMLGSNLIASQSESATVIGKYNESTSMYMPFEASTTYNQGDCVTAYVDNFEAAVWRCKADGTTGQYPPSSGTTGNTYWDYVDDGTGSSYAFVIGNGTYSSRSNALTVDWNGNLVCNNIPACPSSDGTYTLQVVVSSGVPTYSWVAQS